MGKKIKSDWHHLPYGINKRMNKLHPHNECEICSENNICKSGERQKAKRKIERELLDIEENLDE